MSPHRGKIIGANGNMSSVIISATESHWKQQEFVFTSLISVCCR